MPRHSLHVLLSSTLALGLVCGCGSSQRRGDYSEGTYLVPPQPATAPPAPGDPTEEPMEVRNGYDGPGVPQYPVDTRPDWEYETNPFQPANPPGLNVNPFEGPTTVETGDPGQWTAPPVEAPRPPVEVTPELALKELGATVERDAMGRVVTVDLSGTRVADDDLAVLRELPDVRQLDVSSTGITDSGLKYVASLPELQLLALSGTGVGDAGIAQLKSLRLRFLLLGFTSVSDASIETLARMDQLEGLSLRGTKITGDGLARLKKSLPKCKIVADPQTSSTGSARPAPATEQPSGPTYPVDSTRPRRNDTPALRDRSTQNGPLPGIPAGTALRPGSTILSDAEQQLIQIAVGNLTNPRTFDAVGEYYAATGRLDDAIPWLRSAVEAAPEQRTYRYHLGLVLARLGRTDEALGHFEAAVGSPAAHYNLGVVSYQRDDLSTSRQHFREALRQNPGLEPAREWLQRVERDIAAGNGQAATRQAMSR